MKALIYTRVSGPSDPRTASLESQEESCRVTAARIGATVAKVYTERHTGAELHERPQLMAAMDELRKGEAQALICHSVDRLSRDPLHLGVILSAAEQFGWQVHFALDAIDPSTMEGQLVAVVRGIAAKIQRLSIIEATRRGQLKRIHSGKIPLGKDLYGYRLNEAERREVYEPEAAIVRQIFDWYTKDKIGFRGIAKLLHEQGTPTPSQSKNSSVQSPIWGLHAVAKIINNPAYAGREYANRQKVETRINRTTGKKYKARVFRPLAEAIPLGDITPALVSQEQWQAAQDQLKQNRGDKARNQRHPYLLRGMVFCAACRRRMIPIRPYEGGYFYRCQDYRLAVNRGCGYSVKGEEIEAFAWKKVGQFLISYKRLLRQWEQSQATGQRKDFPALLAHLQQKLRKLERGRDRLIEVIATTDDDATIDSLREKLHTIADDRTALLRQIEASQSLAVEQAAPADKIAAITALVVQLRAETVESFEEKRRRLEELNCQVYCAGGQYAVHVTGEAIPL